MFFTIAIMALFIVIMITVDHRSRYTLYFIMMAVGAMIALFFLILYINTFANYGSYGNESLILKVDAYLFSAVTNAFPMPFIWRQRIINLGISIFLLAEAMLGRELAKEYYRNIPDIKQKNSYFSYLFLAIPLISLILTDYRMATWLHHIYWKNNGSIAVKLLLYAIQYGFKTVVFLQLSYSVMILYLLIRKIAAPLFKRKLILLTFGVFMVNLSFYIFFFVSRFSIMSDKVVSNGFWMFENINGNIPKNYSFMFIVPLIIMTFVVIVLLSFRLDVTIFGLYQNSVKKNVKLLNEALGETLHSDKNLFFSMQILMNKTEEIRQGDLTTEEQRLKVLINDSLKRTTQMLDAIRNVNFKYGYVDFLEIIDMAVSEIVLPEGITLEWDRKSYENMPTKGYYDSFHLARALVNVLSNSIEAIQAKGENGVIRIEIQQLFGWMVIAVFDNGIGIKEKHKEIFSPHYSGKRGAMNWGLGLPYVYKVVKSHLGQVFIESKYREYTWFYMMLPNNTKQYRRRRRISNG